MADLSRIEPLMKMIKELNATCMKYSVPLSVEEKEALLQEHSLGWDIIMHKMQVQRVCANCEHCVKWNGKTCCGAREMAPIPFEVENRVGGCSKWIEKDFVPF